jgi:hypothetical protein
VQNKKPDRLFAYGFGITFKRPLQDRSAPDPRIKFVHRQDHECFRSPQFHKVYQRHPAARRQFPITNQQIEMIALNQPRRRRTVSAQTTWQSSDSN